MPEILTHLEMEERFAAEWLLVGDPVTDESMNVTAGALLFHSKDRDQMYREAVRLRPARFATIYTGKLSKDAAIVL